MAKLHRVRPHQSILWMQKMLQMGQKNLSQLYDAIIQFNHPLKMFAKKYYIAARWRKFAGYYRCSIGR